MNRVNDFYQTAEIFHAVLAVLFDIHWWKREGADN